MRLVSLNSMLAIVILLSGFSLLLQVINSKEIFAQVGPDISISIVNSSFAPLTTVNGSQIRLGVMYQLNNESLEDVKINGIMRIYSSNGTLIHSSSFPEGFVAKKDGGIEVFKTTINDPAVKNVVANVTFINFVNRKDTLSNTVSVNLTFQELSNLTVTGIAEDEQDIALASLELKQNSSQ
jgi:hypothetical protein